MSSFSFVGASWKVQDRRLFRVRAEPDTTTEAWKEPKSIVKLTFFLGGAEDGSWVWIDVGLSFGWFRCCGCCGQVKLPIIRRAYLPL